MTEADLLLTGGRVYTVDPRLPWAEGFAIADGHLLAVGSGTDLAPLRGPGTTVRDLDGAFVMPGFLDVHNHHSLAGRTELYELSFPGSLSVDEILDRVRAYAEGLPPDGWVTGGAWASTLAPELNSGAVRRRLDAAAGGRPVILMEDTRHNRWVSTRALELAGITATTVPPEGGVILLDPQTNEPTGVLLEAAGLAAEHAFARAGAFTAEHHRRSAQRGIELLNSHGVTGFQDAAASLDILGALRSLDDAGELDAWVVSSLLVNDPIFGVDPVGAPLLARREEFRTAHHRPDFVKIFLDGVPPARTACFLEPYLPDDAHGADYRGATTMTPDELHDWLERACREGLSAKIHCTGDGSARLVLDTVARLRADGHEQARFQIAHGQFLADDDIPRLARLGVSADISPFLWFPGVIPDAIKSVLPPDRATRMQPNRALLDAGALVAAGSDWPVSESPDPWQGIEGLVTRADPLGRAPGTLWPQQAISLQEAIEVFTVNAAEAMGLGGHTGSLTTGKSADFVVVDRDPFSVAAESLARTVVLETWFSGRRVFERAAGGDDAGPRGQKYTVA